MHAKTVAGINKVRIGAGGHEAVVKIHEGLKAKEKELGIKVKEDGWVELA